MLNKISFRFFNKKVEVFKSEVHSRGVRAKFDIKSGTRIGEYFGRKISLDKSNKLYEKMLQQYKKDSSKAAVYTFSLDDKTDLDGDVWYNLLKYVNHSCQPNCETVDEDGVIFLEAISDIKKGEELFFNYGYDVENWEDHPCYCNSKNCVGYIVCEDQWAILDELKKENN